MSNITPNGSHVQVGVNQRVHRPAKNRKSEFFETSPDKFFGRAAKWVAQTVTNGKPDMPPPKIPVGLDGRFFDGRGVFHSLFTQLQLPDQDIDQRADVAYEHGLVMAMMMDEAHLSIYNDKVRSESSGRVQTSTWDEAKSIFDEDEDYSRELDDRCMPDKVDDFDGGLTWWETGGDVASSPANAPEKPKKAVDKFAKMFDWINGLKISQARRAVVAQLVRYGCNRAYTWVANATLANELGVNPRQIQKQLRAIEKDGIITIRKYTKSWCTTQRMIFINRLAEQDGIDPQMDLPATKNEFHKATAKAWKRKQLEQTTTSISPSESPIGCPLGRGGDVLLDTQIDKGLSLPKGREKAHTAKPNPPLPLGGRAVGQAVVKNQSQSRSEAEMVEESKKTACRPPMDWPEKHLPATDQESALAKAVRQGRITHVHPDWMKRMGCWMVKIKATDDGRIYTMPKITSDGWIANTCDAAIVPLIDGTNKRISQDDFLYQLMTTGIKEPDRSKPVAN